MNYDDVPFDEKLEGGKNRFQLLASGAVYDHKAGHIVARKQTTEYAREMSSKRWDKYREATASRILKEAQAIDPDIKTEEDAWALLVGRTYVAIMDSDKPRGDDLEKVGKAMGAVPNTLDVKRIENEILSENPPEWLSALAKFALDIKPAERETIEGKVLDDEP